MGRADLWRDRHDAQRVPCRECGRVVPAFYEAPGLNRDGTLTCYYECQCGQKFAARVDPNCLPPRPDGLVLVVT